MHIFFIKIRNKFILLASNYIEQIQKKKKNFKQRNTINNALSNIFFLTANKF